MADAQPKCTRLTVTAEFANGTSIRVDIPEPADVTMDFNRLPSPPPLDFFTMSLVPETSAFVIRAQLGLRGAQAVSMPAKEG